MLELLTQLLTYDEILDLSSDMVTLSNAVFKEDFGTWRKRYQAHIIQLSSDDDALGVTLAEYNANDELVKSVKVKLGVVA